MPMIVIENERSLPALNRRLLRSDAPPEAVEELHRRIRRDNPEVDFDDLRAGTVLRIPESPHLRARESSSLQEVVDGGLERLQSASTDDIARRRRFAAEELKGDAAQRRAMAKRLGSRRVRAVVEKHPELAPAVEGAEQALLADADGDLRRAEAVEQATAQWAEQLEVLRRLRP